MNVVVTLSQRFERSPDGRVWTPAAFAYPFWTRYLEVFDGVRVVARVRDVAAAPAGWNRADGDGVVFTPIPYFRGPWQYLLKARRVARTARAAIGPTDAVLLRVPSELARCVSTYLRQSGHPYGVEVVGDPYEVFAPGALRHPLRPFLRWYFPAQLRRQCAGACGVAYVSRHVLPQRYPCPHHAAYFSDVELPPAAWVSAPRPPRPDARAFTLVTIASLEQLYKAPDVLIDAVAVCVRDGWDLRLVFVGGGRHRAELEARAASRCLAERVVFHGQVPAGEGVRAALDAADLFVLPSRTEGLPRAMLEAMARGLPCLGSRVGGIPELLSEKELVEPGNVAGLAAKIAEVLSDPDRLSRLSARNLARAAEYRPDILRERMLAFYRHVRNQTQAWLSEEETRKSGAWRVACGEGRRSLFPRHTPLTTSHSSDIRLLHVTTVPQSLGFLREQVRYVQKEGFNVHVLSSPGESLERFGTEEQVVTHAVSMPRRITPLRDLWTLGRLCRILRRVRPDIVHGHTPKGGLLAMLAAWCCGVPVRVYHIHGLPLMTASGWRRRLLRWTEKTACLFAQQVFCVSASVRQVAVEEGLCPAEKVRVLLDGSIDGMNADRFDRTKLSPETQRRVREQYGIPPDALVLGFVGRVVRDKGLIELAEAWQRLRMEFPDAHLLIVGGTEPQDPIPPDVEDRLHNEPRIHQAGTVRDTISLYAAMDLVVLPSYREGFPIVPLEAAAMELPVVATRIPGCVDAVQDGVTGTLVPVRDAGALADAIRHYLRDPVLRLQHGAAGRQRVLRDFRPEKMGQAVYSEYRRLLASVKKGTRGEGLGTREEARSLSSLVPSPSPLVPFSEHGTFYQRRGKRWLDLLLTLPALVVLAPVFLLLAVLVRLMMGAPVLYRQRRAGRNGAPFTILKFRTMTNERDASGRLAPDSRRLTRLGRFLRGTSLDELPELLNVLRGDMSLVGPRPLLPRYLPYYSPREVRRFERLPGITGWAQINGRNSLGWDERLAHDVCYVESCSLGLDLRILVITVWKVLRRADVHVDTTLVLRSLDEERSAGVPPAVVPCEPQTQEL